MIQNLFGRQLLWRAGLLIAVGALVAACGGTPAPKAPKVEPTLTVAVPFFTSTFAPPFIAEALGYYKQEGVNVTVEGGGGSTDLLDIATGAADLTVFGTTAAFPITAGGKPTSIVYNVAGGGLAGDVAVRSSSTAKSLMDLSGQRVGVAAASGDGWGTLQVYSQYVASHGGRAFIPVSYAQAADMAAALASGGIAAAVGPRDQFQTGLANGSFKLILNSENASVAKQFFGGYFAENAIFGLSSTIKAKSTAVVDFLAAIVKANSWLRSHSATQITTELRTLSGFATTPASALVPSVQYAKSFLSPYNGKITAAMWGLSLKQFAGWKVEGVNLSSPNYSYRRAVNMTYLDQAAKRAS